MAAPRASPGVRSPRQRVCSGSWLRQAAVVLALLGGAARADELVDSCLLGDDRCLRTALELRQAWDRCRAPRLVVDETSYTAGRRRLQGVWCESGGGNGVFHSSPVAWEWLAATGSPGRNPPWEQEDAAARERARACRAQERGTQARCREEAQAEETRRRERWLARLRHRFDNGGALARLVHSRLELPGSRLSAATVIHVEGDRVLVVERQPLGDLRPEDLPWGLVPWRPAWFALPALPDEERAVLERATLEHVIRLPGEDACLFNLLPGARLLRDGPRGQDATLAPGSCREYALRFQAAHPVEARSWRQRLTPTVGEAVPAVLLAPPEAPAFVRVATPNVDAFPVHAAP